MLERGASNAALVRNGEPCLLFLTWIQKLHEQQMCPNLTRLSGVTQHCSVCSASCSVQCANEAPVQDMCGLPSFIQEEEDLQKGHVQLKNRSCLFPSLLPGGGFCLPCQQCVVTVLSVCCIIHKMCMFLPVANAFHLLLQRQHTALSILATCFKDLRL